MVKCEEIIEFEGSRILRCEGGRSDRHKTDQHHKQADEHGSFETALVTPGTSSPKSAFADNQALTKQTAGSCRRTLNLTSDNTPDPEAEYPPPTLHSPSDHLPPPSQSVHRKLHVAREWEHPTLSPQS